MEPLLKRGDVVKIVCGPAGLLQSGDLVCFKRGESMVLHRLIESGCDGLWFEKGDAECSGSWISHEQIVGRPTHVNGTVLVDRGRDRAVRTGRGEHRFVGWRRRLGLPVLPTALCVIWQAVKMRWTLRAPNR